MAQTTKLSIEETAQSKGNEQPGKKNKTIFWLATIILVLWEGVMPLSTVLFAPEYFNAGTKPLGYPDYFAYTLIICKVLGVIAIAYPRTPATLKEWAYAGLAYNLIFAFISHACVDKNIGYMLMPVFFLIVLAVSYIYNKKLQAHTASKATIHQTV